MKKQLLILVSLFSLMYGCATSYPCGEPRKGRCESLTENYKNSFDSTAHPEDLPIDGSKGNAPCPNCGKMSAFSSKDEKVLIGTDNKYNQSVLPTAGSPLIEMPRMMRLWYAPFVDSDNIYHDQQFEYMIVQKKRWNYGNNVDFGRNDDLESTKRTVLVQDNNNSTHKDNDTDSKIENKQQSMTPALNFLQNSNKMGSVRLKIFLISFLKKRG